MIYYWFSIIKILILRNFQNTVEFDAVLKRQFRVGLFDCDGLRVMTASKYPVYMDFIRWEIIARSKLYKAIVRRGFAPTLGSQKIIYRKPLKIWTKFDLTLELAGWDDKWIYHIHHFEQNDEVKAIGITRSLIWKRDIPTLLSDILQEVGAPESMIAPSWVLDLFKDDKEILLMSQSKQVNKD
jgi:acyl-CoA thioesterase FadM